MEHTMTPTAHSSSTQSFQEGPEDGPDAIPDVVAMTGVARSSKANPAGMWGSACSVMKKVKAGRIAHSASAAQQQA